MRSIAFPATRSATRRTFTGIALGRYAAEAPHYTAPIRLVEAGEAVAYGQIGHEGLAAQGTGSR